MECVRPGGMVADSGRVMLKDVMSDWEGVGMLLWDEVGVKEIVDDKMSLALVPKAFGKFVMTSLCFVVYVSHVSAVSSLK